MKQSIRKIAAVFVFAGTLALTATGAFASWQRREYNHIQEHNRHRLHELSRPSISDSYRDSIISNMKLDNSRADRLRRSPHF